jgi:hypothetical protein
MSEPKRYEYVSDGYTARFINPKTGHAAPYGEYVGWEDYARLKAEVERLQDFNDGLMAMRWQDEKGNLLTASDYNRLKAEVERLTEAGDAMYESKIGYYGEQILEDMKHHSGELCRNWNAAKEGKTK